MANQEQEQNRSEKATPFKLKEARERGVVAKSTELTSAVLILLCAAVVYVSGQGLIGRQLHLDAALLSRAHMLEFSESGASAWLSVVFMQTLELLAPLFVALIVGALLSGFLQAGPVFSFQPLQPDFDRVNPVSGFKKFLSVRLVFETIKNILKLAILGYAIVSIVQGLLPFALGLSQTDPHAFGRLGLDVLLGVVFKLAIILIAIAALDAGYVRWDYRRKMMMSRRELKEEAKRREGDPKIKARIRELQKEMRKRSRALKRVPDADVLITNPQHLAVALAYDTDTMSAPQVIAKGAGEIALHMRLLARRHRIPIVQNRPLARALFLQADLDHAIPNHAYRAVARVLAWAYAAKDATKNAGAHRAGANS
jgi:flagellar biosynthesis protein FlhB